MRVSQTKQKNRISQFLVTTVSFGLFVYFAYHLLHGDQGYFALKGLEDKLATAEKRHIEKVEQRTSLENRVKLLRPDSLDLDLLDERARVVLGFVKPTEKVIITAN